MLKINKFYSYNIGKLPKGCVRCVKGEKLVLFATGICPRKCYFCPVSDQKYQKDVIFANERRVRSFNDVLREAKNMNAKGAGITGGDPLAKLNRTTEYIKKLKKYFGKKFHMHLYTSLNLVSEKTLEKLYLAGLDEIRFHFDLDSKKLWEMVKIASRFNWDIGVELPLIPTREKELKELIDYINGKVKFLNLNELEIADNKHSKLLKMGFHAKDRTSYAVKGSLKLGLKLMDYIKRKYKMNAHLCTAKLKDAVQLGNRIKRQAKIVKHGFDIVDKDGMLIRGALYLNELYPGFGYRNKLMKADKKKYAAKLRLLANKTKEKLELSKNDFLIDKDKPRILLSKSNLIKNKKIFLRMGLLPAIVVEYPTADNLEMDVWFVE